jgi:hypothetical protein
MKRIKTIGSEGKVPESITVKMDLKFQEELLDFLRRSVSAQSAQVLATHFGRPLNEVEHYLDRLSDGKLAQYVHVGRGEWGWVAAQLDKN